MADAEGVGSGGRIVATCADLDRVDFAKAGGLVAVVVQDARDGAVLMLAFANREALEATLSTGEMHFWSRSRRELWRKGATSGDTLPVKELLLDCDQDAVLALVEPAGPACHLGERTCWGEGAPKPSCEETLRKLDAVIAERSRARPEGSYTTRLLADGNLRLKKLGEEGAELIASLASGDEERAVSEAADLLYHVLVALRAEGVGLEEVARELRKRSGR